MNNILSEKNKFRLLAFATGILLVVGTVFYHLVEKLSWLDSFYFSTVTLATVGYGDISPETPLGKLFTIVYIFTGIGIIVAFAQALVLRIASKRMEKHATTKT